MEKHNKYTEKKGWKGIKDKRFSSYSVLDHFGLQMTRMLWPFSHEKYRLISMGICYGEISFAGAETKAMYIDM